MQKAFTHRRGVPAAVRELVAGSFDVAYYRATYPDVAQHPDPVGHYLEHGWREGRNPRADFDTRYYLEANADVGEHGTNPFYHYLRHGRAEGRLASPPPPLQEGEEYRLIAASFDTVYYRQANPDVASYPDLIEHYILYGWKEGRNPSPDFDTNFYLERNADVRDAKICPLYHYLRDGQREGRKGKPEASKAQIEYDAVAQEFDAEYYLATNRDLSDLKDPVAHYNTRGWREGRDPSPDFSSEFYLLANPDIRQAGINPFFHYLRDGRAEGRLAQRSTRMIARLAKADVPEAPALSRTGVVVLIKNEIDIIEAFLSHLLALFDVIVIVDHGSQDGTRQVIDAVADADSRVTVYSLEVPSYIQALTMNHVARTAPELRDVDWLFFLDADEFLPFASRADFDAALAKHASATVISMAWLNAVPETYWDSYVDLRESTTVYLPSRDSDFRKIAYRPRMVDRQKVWVEQGNHAILAQKGSTPLLTQMAEFPLIHLPVRSRAQLMLKLNQGVLAYLKLGSSRSKLDGSHWFRLQDALQQVDITDEVLNAVVSRYGAVEADVSPISLKRLQDGGYQPVQPRFAQHPVEYSPGVRRDFDQVIFRLSATAAGVDDGEAAQPRPVSRLQTTADRRIVRADDDSGYEFRALEAEPTSAVPARKELPDHAFLAEFLRPSYWSIDDLTPSAWTGHIPFLFALTGLERPRRYVELGSHFGASFFAYCQAVARLGYRSTPVAVDSWEGDVHAGLYDNLVFEKFKFIFKKYADFAVFMRMYFSVAARSFEDGSVDLLHIDGLHTYEAVREDYETWLPKMSTRGIILLHDIGVHERDFGVWKFWGELQERHPTMELRHSHGLGVAYVGADTGRDIERLIKLVRDDKGAWTFLQQHFEEISQKSCELATANGELARLGEQVRAVAKLREDVSRLRQALSASQEERDQYKELIGS